MAEALPVARFSSGALPRPARYDAWRSLVSAVFVSTLPDDHDHRDLRVRVNSINFGQALIFDIQADAQGFVRSPRLVATEQLDHYLFQVYRSGVCDGTYGDVQNTVYPGDIKVVDLARPFQTSNTDFDNITLTIPRVVLAPLLARPDALHRRVMTRHSAMNRVVAAGAARVWVAPCSLARGGLAAGGAIFVASGATLVDLGGGTFTGGAAGGVGAGAGYGFGGASSSRAPTR